MKFDHALCCYTLNWHIENNSYCENNTKMEHVLHVLNLGIQGQYSNLLSQRKSSLTQIVTTFKSQVVTTISLFFFF